MECPPLTTARLALRAPEHRDCEAVVRHIGDWEVARNLQAVPHPYGAEDAEFWLERIVPAHWVWAITRQGEGDLMGVVSLIPKAESGLTELGYWLGRKHWGQGIMTEAARAVVAFGFETLALAEIASGYFADNHASGAVLGKLGFIETGRSVRPCVSRGVEVPSVDLRLLRPAGA